MHRVLQISEIVCVVFGHLRNERRLGALCAAARGCKAFKELALDALWYELPSLEPLLSILPLGVIKHMKNGLKVLTRTLRSDEWPGVLSYTFRVHAVSLRHNDTSGQAIYALLMSQSRLLPKLVKLKMKNAHAQDLYNILPLLDAPLTDITIHTVNQFSVMASDIFHAFLEKVAEIPSRLQVLNFLVSRDDWDDGEDDDTMSYFAETLSQCSQLVSVNIGYVDNLLVLRALAGLPNLKKLTLTMRLYFDVEVSDENKSRTTFTSLEELIIDSTNTNLSHTVNFLSGQRCFARSSIRIDCGSVYEEDISAFLAVVLHPTVSTTLQQFSFTSDEVTDNDPPSLHFAVLHPLLALHELRTLKIESSAPVRVSDADLHDVAASWPNLRVLELDTGLKAGEIEYEPEATLSGIAELSRCVHLQRLELAFQATSPPSSPGFPPCTSLTSITVGLSEIISASEVADFFSERFPSLSKVRCRSAKDILDDLDCLIGSYYSRRQKARKVSTVTPSRYDQLLMRQGSVTIEALLNGVLSSEWGAMMD